MRFRRAALGVVTWVFLTFAIWIPLFTASRIDTVIAGHEAELSPTFDHHVLVDLGPYLPALRTTAPARLGVEVRLGRTDAASVEELVDRYVLLAAHPQVEIHQVEATLIALGLRTALRAGSLAVVPILVWWLIGRGRRAELVERFRRPRPLPTVAVTLGLVVVTVGLVQPWRIGAPTGPKPDWIPIAAAVPDVKIPPELAGWEVRGGLITANTRRLVASAVSSYDRSVAFFSALVDAAPTLATSLRVPEPGETVAVLVSDRHDNIGMDPVVRAVADVAGASIVIDAGDDTSVGAPWESFSLDALTKAFDGYQARLSVAGNHDHGDFVSGYLGRSGWARLGDGRPRTVAGIRFFGMDDPRDSGLGDWRDEPGASFSEVRQAVGDEVCRLDAAGERVAVLVVHDANLGASALGRGCVDLVVGGHLHVQVDPELVRGDNGRIGYSYTNGTTGGAAYAVAVGSKIRREAGFTFLTFRDGRPIGVQPIRISTLGVYTVDPYQPLVFDEPHQIGPVPQ